MSKLGLFPKKKKNLVLQAKALPADVLSRTAYLGGCKSNDPKSDGEVAAVAAAEIALPLLIALVPVRQGQF